MLNGRVRKALQFILVQGGVPRSHGVNHLFVNSPEFIPFKRQLSLRSTLRENVRSESLDGHSATPDPTNGSKSRVIPPGDMSIVHKPGQFALRQKSVNKVESRVVPDMDPSQVQGLQEPLVLGVTVTVLVCSEGVGNAFERVDNGTDKVVGRVHFEAGSGVWVRNEIAAVNDGVAEGLVLVLHEHLGSKTAFEALHVDISIAPYRQQMMILQIPCPDASLRIASDSLPPTKSGTWSRFHQIAQHALFPDPYHRHTQALFESFPRRSCKSLGNGPRYGRPCRP